MIFDRIKFTDNLKQLMKDNNLNQTTLSEKIGIAQSAISAWLSGKKEPSITSLWLLADLFDVDIDYLIGRKDF
ncbi:MAG: helix-turn-helix transcriptional regulator [Clostridia bacterium]|nr:helix-turn-helix transcriptional regulator [Clostridia bacterium]